MTALRYLRQRIVLVAITLLSAPANSAGIATLIAWGASR